MIFNDPIFSSEFIKNIEEAIKEYGTLACPNPKCNNKLVSKKKWIENKKILEYQCLNSNCHYHKKRQISLENKSISLIKSANKLSYSNIFIFVGICLFVILLYTSSHLYSVNQFLKDGLVENQANKNPDELLSYSDLHDVPKINRKPTLVSKGAYDSNQIEKVDIEEFAKQTKTWLVSGNFNQGKINFNKLIEDKQYQSTLLLPENDLTRYQLIELIGDSYKRNSTQLSYKLLEHISDFNLLKRFMKTFDVEKKYFDIFLGKAYLHLPNRLQTRVNLTERKKMQMIALRHYLQAAKDNNFANQKSTSIEAINELSKVYMLFKYNPKKTSNFKTTETLIRKRDIVEIQNRIDYISAIIKRIS